MIEITDGFTSISAGADSLEALVQGYASSSGKSCPPRRPTGARVTVEFRRESSLSPKQAVTVRYAFVAEGRVRQLTGIPTPVRTVVRQGRAVVYCYRMSHWIAASELTDLPVVERPRRDARQTYGTPGPGSESGRVSRLKLVAGATAIDPFPA